MDAAQARKRKNKIDRSLWLDILLFTVISIVAFIAILVMASITLDPEDGLIILEARQLSTIDLDLLTAAGDFPVGTEVLACGQERCQPALVVDNQGGVVILSTRLTSGVIEK